MEQGEIYVVPFSLTVHCVVCGEDLEAGDCSWIEDGTGSILCLRCVSKRQNQAKVGPTEFKPAMPALTKRQATRAAEWMQFD